MGFIFAETAGMHGAAAVNAGLAGETGGAGGTTAAAGAVVPPGLEEVSAANVARIETFVAEASAMLATAAGFQGVYSASVSTSAAAYDVTDTLNSTGLAL